MPDDEFDSALNTTAGKMDEMSDEIDDRRRQALNVNARARGLIDDGEDVIDEYRGTGIGAVRGMQSWIDGNKSGIDDIDTLLDDLEDQVDTDDGGWGRRDYLKAGGAVGATAFAGGAAGSFLAGLWPFGGSEDPGPVYVDRSGFQDAYEELSEADQMSVFGDAVYEEMFDGEDRDLIAGYFDHNPSEDQTDSSFKYFFAENIDDYMVENEDGEEVFDYSQLDSEDLRMDSISWQNTNDSIAETFEKYGTRNKEQVPDLLEGGLE
jgi:hypothetical protein